MKIRRERFKTRGLGRLLPGHDYDALELEPLSEVEETNDMKSDDTDSTLPNDLNVSSQEITDFSDITGGNGVWQIRILVLTTLANIPLAWNHLAIAFFAIPQDHWCAMPSEYNVSTQEWLQKAFPNHTFEGVTNHSKCEMFNISSWTDDISNNTEIIPCKQWEYYPNELTITEEWNLVCSRKWLSSMNQAVYMAGFFVAVLICGQMSDTFGRHPVIIFTVVILLMSGFAAALSTSLVMFTVFRFFVAVGHAGLGLTLYVLLVEVVGPDHRTLFCYLQGFGWPIGYCLLPLFAWHWPAWRSLQLVITIPCLVYISFYWLLPESPRWLLVQKKHRQATHVLKLACKFNGRKVHNLKQKIEKLCFKENEVFIEEAKPIAEKATILDLFRTPNLRKKTLILYVIWVSIAFSYYGLSLNTGQLGGNYYLNFFLSGLVEIPACFLCMYTMRFGRKMPFLLINIGAGVACLIVILIPKTMHWYIISFAMLGKMLVSTAFGIVYIYSAEIFPTVVRNVGIGSSSMAARIGSLIAPFMKDLGEITNFAVPMALFSVISFLGGILIIFLPETKGKRIPETLIEAESAEDINADLKNLDSS